MIKSVFCSFLLYLKSPRWLVLEVPVMHMSEYHEQKQCFLEANAKDFPRHQNRHQKRCFVHQNETNR